jgi:serine/threonine protein kinase
VTGWIGSVSMSGGGADPEPGAELGPFRIGNRLGVGGMGIVFQALDTHLNRQVALKVISPHIGDNPEFRERFTREAQAQASLDSPHVVQVYSFGEADGRLYIASQLMPDGDLGQMLSRHGPPPARIAVNLISQVADGLADAHAAGLVHRDIKPANVLLRNRDSQLQAFLGDFGIARQLGVESGLTQAGGTVGTPSYMAPELHLGRKAGAPSDLYSLGCLLWAALSGTPPYAGGTDYQVMMAHVEQPAPQLPASGPLAHEINRVLRTAMAKDPGDRYPSASAMRDDLRAVVRLPDDPTPGWAAQPAAPGWAVPAVTPTPTPTPTPVPQAPPAPIFRQPTPSTPQFSTMPTANYHQSESSSTGRGAWIAAGVVVVLLVVGAIVAAVLLAGDDGGGSADDSPVAASTSSPVEPVAEGDREARAVQALAAAFTQDGTADPAAADCFARSFVETVGVDRLVETGVLTEDLEYDAASQDTEAAGVLLEGIGTATFACISELSSSSPSIG